MVGRSIVIFSSIGVAMQRTASKARIPELRCGQPLRIGPGAGGRPAGDRNLNIALDRKRALETMDWFVAALYGRSLMLTREEKPRSAGRTDVFPFVKKNR